MVSNQSPADPLRTESRYLPPSRAPGPANDAIQENPRHLLPRRRPLGDRPVGACHQAPVEPIRTAVKHAQRRLESRAGKRYKEVVLKCLQGDFGVEDNTYERGYEMLDVIEQTANSV